MRTAARRLVVAGLAVGAIAVVSLAVAMWKSRPGDGGNTADGRSLIPPALAADIVVDPEVRQLIDRRRSAVLSAPRDVEARRQLALAFQGNGLYEMARDAYLQAVEVDDRCAKCWHSLAHLAARRGDTADALLFAGRAIALDAGYAPAQCQRGYWLLDEGQVDEAMGDFEAVLAANPTSPAAQIGAARVQLSRGEVQPAIERLERLVVSQPALREQPYLRQVLGTAYARAGRADAARVVMQNVGSAPPEFEDPWLEEANDHRAGYLPAMQSALHAVESGRPDEAIRTLEGLLRSRPNDESATVLLAQAHGTKGDVNRSRGLLEQVLRKNPKNYDALLMLSSLYEQMRDYARSLAEAQRAAAADPARSPAWVQIGRIHATERRAREAAEAIARAIALGDNDPGIRVFHGRLLLDVGDWSGAARIFEQMIRANPMLAAAYVGLARAKAETGDVNTAIALLQRGQQLDPNDPLLQPTAVRIRSLQSVGPVR